MTDKLMRQAKETVSQRSGLPIPIIEALFKAGYSYNEKINLPAMWIRDSLDLVERDKTALKVIVEV